MTMSLAESKLQHIYMNGLTSEQGCEGDECHRRMEWPKPERLLRNSNLALVGFPNSLKSFDIAYFRQNPALVKQRQIQTQEECLKSHIAMVTHGRCGRRSGVLPYLGGGGGGGDVGVEGCCDCIGDERCSDNPGGVSRIHTCEVEEEEGAMKTRRGPPLVCRPDGREAEDSAGSPLSKRLKFGIEAILAIGSKEPEKKHDEHEGEHYSPKPVRRWSGETRGADARKDPMPNPTVISPVSRPMATGPGLGLDSSSWGRVVTQPLVRWDHTPASMDGGRVGWTFRDHRREYHDFGSQCSPYQWPRHSDPNTQHCYPLQPTLPPSHPTLPRSYHHPIHVSTARQTGMPDCTGYDIKANIGGSGGMPGVSGGHKRKRSWSRAVFTSLQRKGLEKRFDIQKYVNKPERRQLASALGLSDAQVKVWFQNRRMKWRHTQQFKRPLQEQHEQPTAEHPTEEHTVHTDSDLDSSEEGTCNTCKDDPSEDEMTITSPSKITEQIEENNNDSIMT